MLFGGGRRRDQMLLVRGAHGGAKRGILRRGGDADAVHGSAGARRDETADDDIFLEALQRVDLALHRRFGEDAGRLLEGRRRNEAARLQARLGDAEEDRAATSARWRQVS